MYISIWKNVFPAQLLIKDIFNDIYLILELKSDISKAYKYVFMFFIIQIKHTFNYSNLT